LKVPKEDALATSVRDAIEKLSKVFAEQPTKARSKNPSATAVLENGVKFQVTGPYGEKVSTDMPSALGGGSSAPNPGWLLRASLASCHATVIAMRAAQVGVTQDSQPRERLIGGNEPHRLPVLGRSEGRDRERATHCEQCRREPA